MPHPGSKSAQDKEEQCALPGPGGTSRLGFDCYLDLPDQFKNQPRFNPRGPGNKQSPCRGVPGDVFRPSQDLTQNIKGNDGEYE